MKKQLFALPLIAAGLLIFSCATSKKNDTEKEPENITEKEIPETISFSWSMKTRKNSTNFLEYEIQYPVFDDNKVLNKGIEKHFLNYFEEFVSAAEIEWNALCEERMAYSASEEGQDYFDPPPMEYFGSPENIWESSDFISIIYDEYSYLGGAHGSPLTKTLTYSKKNNKVVNIEEASGIPLDKISHMCYEVLLDMFDQDGFRDLDWLQTGTEPVEENFSSFAITEDGNYLIVYFNPYQVAPYSYGILSVKIEI